MNNFKLKTKLNLYLEGSKIYVYVKGISKTNHFILIWIANTYYSECGNKKRVWKGNVK